jgi:hypothetical protein
MSTVIGYFAAIERDVNKGENPLIDAAKLYIFAEQIQILFQKNKKNYPAFKIFIFKCLIFFVFIRFLRIQPQTIFFTFCLLIMFSDDDLIFLASDQSLLDTARGGFARSILAVVAEAPGRTGSRDFLLKVLAAAQVNLEQDTLLVEISNNQSIAIAPALKEKQVAIILVFGLSPRQVGLYADIPLYEPCFFYNTTWLFADALSELEPDKNLKGLLWRALQQVFLK